MSGPELLKPESCQPPDGFLDGVSPLALPPTPAIPPPEEVVPVMARYIFLCTLGLHPGVVPPALRDICYWASAEIFIKPLCPAGTPTSAPKAMPWDPPSGTPHIPIHNFCAGEIYTGGRQIPGDEGPGAPVPAIFVPSSPTVDVGGVALVD